MSYPKPLKSVGALLCECAKMEANPYRVKNANLLEPNGRMSWVRFEDGKALVGKRSDSIWKLAVVKPEVRIGEVLQSGVQRPAS